MNFVDLTPYEYYLGRALPNVFNVGWLSGSEEFQERDLPAGFLEKLEKIAKADRPGKYRVNAIRGVHPCNFCGERSFENSYAGSCEIWVPCMKSKRIYASPSLIVHYVEVHNYLPPAEFIDAVLFLDINQNFNGQDAYDKALANG